LFEGEERVNLVSSFWTQTRDSWIVSGPYRDFLLWNATKKQLYQV